MQASDLTQVGYWAKGSVHAVDQQRMITPCGLAVKPKKLRPQTFLFGTNCPQCYAFVKEMRADEDARGLHDVRLKPEREQSALVIFKLRLRMTPEFIFTSSYAHAVERSGFGADRFVRQLLFRFEHSLSATSEGKWPTDTSLITSRFLAYAAANDDLASDSSGEWSICRQFNESGANVHAHTYWMHFDPDGVKDPEFMYQMGSC